MADSGKLSWCRFAFWQSNAAIIFPRGKKSLQAKFNFPFACSLPPLSRVLFGLGPSCLCSASSSFFSLTHHLLPVTSCSKWFRDCLISLYYQLPDLLAKIAKCVWIYKIQHCRRQCRKEKKNPLKFVPLWLWLCFSASSVYRHATCDVGKRRKFCWH